MKFKERVSRDFSSDLSFNPTETHEHITLTYMGKGSFTQRGLVSPVLRRRRRCKWVGEDLGSTTRGLTWQRKKEGYWSVVQSLGSKVPGILDEMVT